MKKIGIALGIVVALVSSAFGAMMLASEQGEEVITLRTFAAGTPHETRLWVVDDDGHAWLRSGMGGSGWLERIRIDPAVEIERGGRTLRFTAVVVPGDAPRERIHRLMRERYGFADRVVSAMRDGSGAIAVRLDPR